MKIIYVLILILLLTTMPQSKEERNRKRRERYAATKAKKRKTAIETISHKANTADFEAEWSRRRDNACKSKTYRANKAAVKAKERYVGF